jgi:YHS domain-containing protein
MKIQGVGKMKKNATLWHSYCLSNYHTREAKRVFQIRERPMGNLLKKNDSDQATDPVCGMLVDISGTALRSNYGGRTYFFCAPGCQRSFESNPLEYLGRKTKKKKGIWGRYMDRLTKATGGKPPSCCS